jgi:hypothetical protein
MLQTHVDDILTKISIFSSKKDIFKKKSVALPDNGDNTLTFLIDVIKQLFGVEKINELLYDFIVDVLPKIESRLKNELFKNIQSHFNCNVSTINDRLINGIFISDKEFDLLGYLSLKKEEVTSTKILKDFDLFLYGITNDSIEYNYKNVVTLKRERNHIVNNINIGDGFIVKRHNSIVNFNDFTNKLFENLNFFNADDILSNVFGLIIPNAKIEKNLTALSVISGSVLKTEIVNNDYYQFNRAIIKQMAQSKYVVDCYSEVKTIDAGVFKVINTVDLKNVGSVKNLITQFNNNGVNGNEGNNIVVGFFKNLILSLTQTLFLPQFILVTKMFADESYTNIHDYFIKNKKVITTIILDVFTEEIIQYIFRICLVEIEKILIENLQKDLKEKYLNYILQLRSLVGL